MEQARPNLDCLTRNSSKLVCLAFLAVAISNYLNVKLGVYYTKNNTRLHLLLVGKKK